MKLVRLFLPALLLPALSEVEGLPSSAAVVSAQSAKGKELALDWNQYRGPLRDGLSPDKGLLQQWPAAGPPLAWKATGVGAGYSSVAVLGTRVYTLGDVGTNCTITALNVADGKMIWQTKIGRSGEYGGYAGSRSTPATDGTMVFALSQHGDLVAVQAATGREVWRKDLKGQFGGNMMSGWGYSESPLLDGNVVACTPGGSKGTVVALNKANGAPMWQSGELKDNAAYTSLIPVTMGNIPQYIVFTDKTVAGIVAKTGRVAWKADRPGQTAVVPTPLYKDGIVFVSSGYGVGHNAFQVAFGGGQFRVKEIYKGREMVNHHGGLVLVGDHVYGADESQLKCIELKTGKVVWSDRCVGKGSITFADGHLVCRGESGPIALVEASPTAYKQKGRFDQPDRSRQSAWPHPVVFGGKLYIRDQDVLLCYNVLAK